MYVVDLAVPLRSSELAVGIGDGEVPDSSSVMDGICTDVFVWALFVGVGCFPSDVSDWVRLVVCVVCDLVDVDSLPWGGRASRSGHESVGERELWSWSFFLLMDVFHVAVSRRLVVVTAD